MAKDTFSYEDLTSGQAPQGNKPATFSYEDLAGEQPARTRGVFEAANDYVIEGANAAAGGVSSAANFFVPGNKVSSFIDENIIKAGEAKQSDVVKDAKRKLSEGLAGASGPMQELGAVGEYIVENPLLAASQAVGSFALPAGAVKGMTKLATLGGAGAGAASTAGRIGGVAAGAAMAGGDAAGTAYELSKKAGATDEQAEAAGRQASVIPALVGGVTGAFGAEKLLAGGKGFQGGIASRALKTGLSEAGQEAIEEGVTQYEGQRAAMPYDPSIDPAKGVAGAAGMGAALGFIPGAGLGALDAYQNPNRPQAQPQPVTGTGAPSTDSPIVGTSTVEVDGKVSTKVNRQDGSVDIDGVQVVPPTASVESDSTLPVDDVIDVEPITPVKPSEAMGIDRAAGPLSRAAADAVDSGASPAITPTVMANPLVQAAQAPAPTPPVVDTASLKDRTTEELRGFLRNAQDTNIRKAISSELARRKREEMAAMPDPLQQSLIDQPKAEQPRAAEAPQAVQSQPQAPQEQPRPLASLIGGRLTDTDAADLVGKTRDPLRGVIQAEPRTTGIQGAANGLPDTGVPAVTGAGAGDTQRPSGVSDAGRVRGRPGKRAVATADAELAQGSADRVGDGRPGTGAGTAALNGRPARWRQNALQAKKVARELGLNPDGKRLAEIVAEVDAFDARSNVQDTPQGTERVQAQAQADQAPEAARGDGAETGRVPDTRAGDGVRADGVEGITRTILESIADQAKKTNRKYYDKQIAKGLMTRDEADRRIANDDKMWAEQKVNDRTERIAKAIAEKDPTVLVGAWAKEGQGTYGNEGSMEAFRKLTGINLARMNSADRAKAIFDWAGWSEDQVRADVEKRRAERNEQIAKAEEKRKQDDAAGIERLAASTKLTIEGQDGETTVKAYIDGLIEQGYTEIGQTKVGAIKRTLLFRPGANSGYPMRGGILADYAKVASERFKAQQPPAQETKPAEKKAQEPKATELTPKQYHEAKLKFIADENGVSLAEVREMYDTEGGRADNNREWLREIEAAAGRGEVLTRQTLDKLYELAPNARMPESAFPDGYQKPEARKAEAEEKQARIDNRKEAKESVKRDAAETERFEAGRSLTKEQRREVLVSLVDVYKEKGADREMKGVDQNGNERYGYVHSPDLFEKSDITGAMVRYYVTLPDGRKAHPTELFPDVSASDVERMALEQEEKRNKAEAYKRAIKPVYSDFDDANLRAGNGQVVISDGTEFAVIPDRPGPVGQARGFGWNVVQKATPQQQEAAEQPQQESKRGLTGVRAKRAAEAEAKRADYFTPGNIVKGYGGYDRVLEYTPVDERGSWSVRVQRVLKQGDQFIDEPNERPRWHSTQPEPKEFASGPVQRAPVTPQQADKQGEATDDRDTFTLTRLNRETNQMEPVTFKRGEYVRYMVGKEEQFGEIDGISQARREFSVDGIWFPMGYAYKAERPAAPERKDMVPMSKVIEKMNAKNGEGLTDADRVPEQKPASKTPTVDRHSALMQSVREGKATSDQFKAEFESLVANKDAVVAELDTMTKAELLKAGGYFIRMRYANEKKGEIIDAIYRQMVSSFVLGDTLSYGMGKGAFEAAVRKHVEATDDAKLEQYAKDRQAAIAEAKAERAAKAAALENPQTLADFKAVIAKHISEGKSSKEAFLSLTPEQRIQFDTLAAEETKDARETRKRMVKTEVRAASQTTGGEIIATKHTRDGYDLFVVQLADRLSKEDYTTVLASAKRMGGWYSSFRGNGAIPGFQFKSRESADAFLKLAAGDTSAAQEQAQQRRDAFEDDRSQSAVERLREMAEKIEDRASEDLSRERKTNTARRARFAAAAERAAEAEKAMARTMRNIAQAIEEGRAKFLDAVRTKSQVEMLTSTVRTAKDNELRAKYDSYAEQEKRRGEPPTAETADFAEFPSYTAFRSDLATLGRQMLEVDGTKKLGQRLMSVADDVSDAYMDFAKENIGKVSQFMRGDDMAVFASRDQAERAIKRSNLTGKAIVLPVKRGDNRIILSPSEAINRGVWTGDGDKRITLTADFGKELVEAIGARGNKTNGLSVPWQFQNTYDRRKALARIGIETPSEFRSALREFIALQERATANKVRELELKMVGRKNDGLDFFPTPAEIADQMVEAADIKPDMAVLEPSAGMGHIADRIRAAGAEPDVIEISPERRELLLEKGYNTQDVNDFTDLKPREFYTFGDVFRAPDGTEGIMSGSGGMASNRVGLYTEGDRRFIGWFNRDELTGVRHRGSDSGYDRIIMNPPFSNRRDAEHVQHAYTLLKPGGRIVAIMGEGVFFGSDKKAQDFRDWLDSVGGTSEKLPAGSFMDPSLPVNTGVSARMVVIDKPAGDAQADEANFGTKEAKRQGTPVDRAVMDMAGEGRDANDILSFIANTSKSPYRRNLARKLLATGANPAVSLGGEMGGGAGFRFLAKYSRKNHEVTLSEAASDRAEQIFLHETVHAATLLALDKGGLQAQQMIRLYESAKKQGLAEGQYGMKNVGEFVAEVFTNPEFQKILKSMKAPEGNLWKRFVALVRRILGMSDGSQDMLTAALEVGARVMRENMPLRAARSFRAEDGPAFMGANQTETPAFRRWFGDSKVVDANGKPLVVYHGTSATTLEAFDDSMSGSSMGSASGLDGFYFTADPTTAGLYAKASEKSQHEMFGRFYNRQNIMPVFLSMQNPLIYKKQRGDQITLMDTVKRRVIGEAKQGGHDGVIFQGFRDTPTGRGANVADVYVAFRPEQIKSAIGNNGNFDPEDADIAHFGIADASPNNAREAVKPVVQLLNDTFKVNGRLSWWHKTVGTPFNLAQRVPEFKRVFDAVQNFINDVSFYGAEAAAKAPKIIPKLETWKDLGKSPISAEDNKAIAAPIFEGTLVWMRDESGRPVKVEDMRQAAAKMTTEQKAQRLLRNGKIRESVLKMWKGLPADQFDMAVNSKYDKEMLNAGVVWTDAELRNQFKLTDEQIGLYREFREATDKSLVDLALSDIIQYAGKDIDPIKDVVMGRSLAEGSEMVRDYLMEMAEANPERRNDLLDTANGVIDKANRVQQLIDRGYAPLQRFGRYTVYAKDENGEQLFFGMYENRWDAARATRQMRQQFPDATIETGMMSEEAYKLFQGISPETLEIFGTMLGMDSQADGATNEAFQQYLKLAKSNRSAMKRLIERKGIAGYSEDASRVLASFLYSNARQTASNLHVGEIMNGVNDIPKNMGDAKDMAMKLARYTMDPQEEAQALRGLLFAQYLGGSIASAMINALQPAQVTFPYLSQFVGVKKSATIMAQAVKDALKRSTGDARLDAALKKAEEDGVVSPQEIFQLMAQAQGKATLKAGDGTKAGDAMAAASNTLSRLSLGWGKVFSIPEQFNRRSTFIAAYRAALEKGDRNPAAFAEQAVKETQFVYNKANRPQWSRGAIGALAFTFKTYSISYVELLQRMAKSGPEGRRAAMLMVGVLFLMAGAGGLPGVEDAEDVVDGIAQRVFGLNFQTRQKRQEWLAELFGEGGARFIENGLSGLPWSPTDVSGRLGLGNLIPGTGIFVKKQDYTRDVAEIAGPAADMTKRFLQGAGLLLQGEVLKAGEIVSPVAIRNMIQGGRMAATDQYTDARGRKVIDTTAGEAALKTIGFQPANVARVQDATRTVQQMVALNKIRESEIADKWAKAIVAKDQDGIMEAQQEMRDWNQANPDSPIRIDLRQIRKRVQALREDKTTRIERTAPKEIRQEVRRELEGRT